MTSITIPDSVESIGSYAFRGCSSLESITLPFVGATLNGTSNTHFGYIFGVGEYSYNDDYIPTSLKTVVITGGESIGDYAFSGCSLLESITIPDSVTSIGWCAFENCSSLTSITIPDSVTSIGEYAFYGCNNLQYNEYDNGLYLGNENNKYVVLFKAKDTNITSCSINENTRFIHSSAFYNCSSLTSITIPDSVTSIGDWAFRYCSSLTDITIPDSVTSIGERAFYNCNSLTGITIPDSVEDIGQMAFFNCRSLTSITIPDSVTSIGMEAFWGCSSLESITIPDSVTSIDSSAFYNCSSLESITVESGNSKYQSTGNCIIETESKTLILGCKTSVIPTDGSVTSIGYNAFFNCSSLTSITIPDRVIRIGYQAFYNCSSLESVTIPDSVTSIGYQAFYNCSSLTSIIVDEGNQNYASQDGILYNKAKTEFIHIPKGISGSITIPDTVTNIGDNAFRDCSSLESIVVDENNEKYASQDGILYNKDKTEFIHIPKAISDSVTIPDTVTSIGSEAFRGCSSLTSIIIPDSVTSIGEGAFSLCSSLESVYYNGTVDNWAMIEFGDSTANPLYYAKHLYINGEEVTEVNLTTATKINAYAFYNCSSLTSITIPDSVTSIGSSVFSGCSSLESITIPTIVIGCIPKDNLKTVVLTSGESIGSSAFSGCSSLESITIPDSVTSMGDAAFSGCSSLESIIILGSVTSIGSSAFYNCSSLESVYYNGTVDDWAMIEFDNYYANPLSYAKHLYINGEEATEVNLTTATKINNYAFSGCSSLESIIIPDSVTSIGSSAFYNCSSLESITIPDSVTSIGKDAFRGCSSLTSIIIGDSVTSIGSRAFEDCSSLESITIPDSVTSVDSTAFWDCSSLTSITIPDSVTSIGELAFYNCSSLEKVYSNGNINDWALIEFDNYYANPLSYAKHLYINGEEVTEVNLTTATKINNYAFSGYSSLTSITIPDSVTSIGELAFYNCSSLESVTIGEGVTSIGSSAFWGCSSLESITLPFVGGSIKTSTDIYQYPFGYIFGTSSYTGGVATTQYYYGSSTSSTTSSTYYIPSSLKTVTITGGNILYGAFYNCSSLTSVTIGEGVTSIDSSAFYYCSSLTDITYNGTIEEWNAISKDYDWNYNTSNYTIHCTDGDIAKG